MPFSRTIEDNLIEIERVQNEMNGYNIIKDTLLTVDRVNENVVKEYLALLATLFFEVNVASQVSELKANVFLIWL